MLDEIVAARAGRSWCLFLDRDGVLNRQIVGDYVRTWHDFEWLPGARTALETLRSWAPYLVVVTNQQGIGKGLMTAADVAETHRRMQEELSTASVRVDAIQVCPHLESQGCGCRKPEPGLVLNWLSLHPKVDPSLSLMVGDSLSDLELAHNVASQTGGCASIHIVGRHESVGGRADSSFPSLWEFARAVEIARAAERT